MTAKKQPTVRSLAKELGVSAITVSRALRGRDSVRPALAARIRRHAEKRGYRGDPVVAEVMGSLGRARGGARYRETVAFVWTHQLSFPSDEERGAREVAASLGYRVETIKPWTQGLDEADVSRILWARGIRGVLLAPNNSRPDPRYELQWDKFSAVLLGSSLVNNGLTRVTRDYYHDAKLALSKLHEIGARRVGLVLDASIHERTDRCYAAAFLEHGGIRTCIHFVDGAAPSRDEQVRFDRWLRRVRPDALLSDSGYESSWPSPDMPVAWLTRKKGTLPGLGVRADFERVGREGMRALDGLLRAGSTGQLAERVTISIPGIWSDA